MAQRFQRYLKGLSPEEKKKYKGLKCHQAKALFRVQWLETVWAPYEAQGTFDFNKVGQDSSKSKKSLVEVVGKMRRCENAKIMFG